jgi:hypothetical protein
MNNTATTETMADVIINVPSIEGRTQINTSAVYRQAKVAFLLDYANDSVVASRIHRNGDLAELAFNANIKALSHDRCAKVTPATIWASLIATARLALIDIAIKSR